MKKLSPKKDKLTIKQRKWLKHYIETGNATQAALKSYDTKSKLAAAQIGFENVRKLDITELMEEMGLTDVALLNATAKGLTDANKITATGESFVETPDYATRHRYLDTALKLKKRLGADTVNNNTVNMQINVLDESENALNE